MAKRKRKKDKQLSTKHTHRHIDDVLPLNNPSLNEEVPLLYFNELKINVFCCSIFD
jgi:hypothetical protein